MGRLGDACRWFGTHEHVLLVWLGIAAEAIAELGKVYGGPPQLGVGHVLFLTLVGAGVISTPSRSRVVALEEAFESFSKKDDDDPYDDGPDTLPAPKATSSSSAAAPPNPTPPAPAADEDES